MKNINWNKLTTLIIILFCNTITWAQDNNPPLFGPGGGTGEPDDPDEQPVQTPIDMWIYPAILIGMYFAFRFYYKKRKASLNKQGS